MSVAPGGAEIGVVAVKAVDVVATTTAEGATSVAKDAAETGVSAVQAQVAEVVEVASEIDGAHTGIEVLAAGAPKETTSAETTLPTDTTPDGTPAEPVDAPALAEMSEEEKAQVSQEALDILEVALASGSDEDILAAQERLDALKPKGTTPANEATKSAPKPNDTRPLEARINDANNLLFVAEKNHAEALRNGDSNTIARTEEELKSARARLDALNAEQNESTLIESEETRPDEERLDETRQQIEQIDLLLEEAQRTHDAQTIANLVNERGLISRKYNKLLASTDKEFQKRYLEKIEEEKRKKEKEPFLKKLKRILKYAIVVGPGSIGSSVFSDLKETATEPPQKR